MPYRMVACDIDGTIVDLDGPVSSRTKSTLRTCVTRGMTVVLVTGRRSNSALPIARDIDPTVMLISNDGATVLEPGTSRLLHSFSIPRPTALRLVQLMHAQGYAAFVTRPTPEHPEILYQLESRYAMVREYMRILGTQAMRVSCLEEAMTWDPAKIAAHGEREELQALAAQFKGELTCHVTYDPYLGGHWLQAVSGECDKAIALRLLAGSLGIETEQIVAFGDNYNDAAMLRLAGLGVAMGNAVDELKAAADLIAPRHDEDGVAHILELILEGVDPRSGMAAG